MGLLSSVIIKSSNWKLPKLAEDVPLLRNFMETPGVSPGCVDKSRKFGADQLILMKPITFLPLLKSPVKGESEKDCRCLIG